MIVEAGAVIAKCPACGWYLWGALRRRRGVMQWHCWVCGVWRRWERRK